MTHSFRDMFDPYGAPQAPPQRIEYDHNRPTFGDLLELFQHPKGILSEVERVALRDHLRAILGLRPVEDEVEDEEELVVEDDE